MFRFFLSWRYLRARRTNLIAIVGMFLAVGALVMILSIMTGFLVETRRIVRGSLSDVVVAPVFGGALPRADSGAIRSLAAADPRVLAASARLVRYGILDRPGSAGSGGFADTAGGVLVRTADATLAAVQLVGVDVLTAEKSALASLAAWHRARGVPVSGRLTDELDVSGLLEALWAQPKGGARVASPWFPFRLPPGAPPDAPPGAVLGDQLFRSLGLMRGDVIEVLTALPDPLTGEVRQQRARFTVAGTFRFTDNEADLSWIFVPRRALARAVGAERDYTQVCLALRDFERDAPDLCADLAVELEARRLVRGLVGEEIKTWRDFRRLVLGSIENQRSVMLVILGLIVLVAGFTVFAIISMMVNEKRRDVGILMALGAKPRGLLALFLLIALWDALLGAVSGAAVGTWAALEIDALEAWISRTLGFQVIDRNLYLFDTLPSRVEPQAVGVVLAFTIAVTVLAALVPAWRAARLDPLQAVRQD